MTPDAEPQGSDSGWDAWRERLVRAVAGLADGEILTCPAPLEYARPARLPGLRRRILGQQHADVAPWVTLERSEDHLIARCVSDDKLLGFPLSQEEKDQLAALGWHQPGPMDGPALLRWFPDDVPSAPYLPGDEAARAAELTAATLREVFGAEPGPIEAAGA